MISRNRLISRVRAYFSAIYYLAPRILGTPLENLQFEFSLPTSFRIQFGFRPAHRVWLKPLEDGSAM